MYISTGSPEGKRKRYRNSIWTYNGWEFFKIDEKLYKRWYPWNDRYSSHDIVTQNPSFTKSAFERIPKATWRWHCREWNSAQEGWVQAQSLPPPSYATWRKLPHFSFLNWQGQWHKPSSHFHCENERYNIHEQTRWMPNVFSYFGCTMKLLGS